LESLVKFKKQRVLCDSVGVGVGGVVVVVFHLYFVCVWNLSFVCVWFGTCLTVWLTFERTEASLLEKRLLLLPIRPLFGLLCLISIEDLIKDILLWVSHRTEASRSYKAKSYDF